MGTSGTSTGGATTAPVVTEPNPTEPETSSTEGTGSEGVTTDGVTSDGVTSDGVTSDGVTSDGPTTGEPGTDADFFLAIYATPVAPTTPFQFLADVTAEGGQLELSLTPLSLDILSVDTPREPLPPPFVVSGPIAEDGSFTIEIPDLMLIGQANPVTGSDIVASVTLDGVFEQDRICGQVSGAITVPANIDLTGSYLSGMRIDGGPLPSIDDLDCVQ